MELPFDSLPPELQGAYPTFAKAKPCLWSAWRHMLDRVGRLGILHLLFECKLCGYRDCALSVTLTARIHPKAIQDYNHYDNLRLCT